MIDILTVIIPIRTTRTRSIAKRLEYCISDPLLNDDKINFLVVDDGSKNEEQQIHKNICQDFGITYHYIDSQDKPVNMSRARNVGVQLTQSKYIMFMDVDLFPYPGFYNDVLNEIQIQELESNKLDLLMFSVIYLTKDVGLKLFFETPEKDRKGLFLKKLQNKDTTYIEKFSSGTSVALYHRSAYLQSGGYDEEFCEWGYEDLEFNLRMMCANKKFSIPADFHLDYKTFQTIDKYRGWKSLYKRYGEITLKREIVLFHIWHKIDKDSDYALGYEENRQRFVQKISTLCIESQKSNKKDTLFVRYKNSSIISKVQFLKKLPFIGTILLHVKQKIFKWK